MLNMYGAFSWPFWVFSQQSTLNWSDPVTPRRDTDRKLSQQFLKHFIEIYGNRSKEVKQLYIPAFTRSLR